MEQFLRRRMVELRGAAWLALALALALALVSFHTTDPSFNQATAVPTHNLLGLPGAYLADLLLQTLGLASALIVAGFTVWGVRIVMHKQPPALWLRFTLLPVGVMGVYTYHQNGNLDLRAGLVIGFGIFFGAWHTSPIVRRVLGEFDEGEFAREVGEIQRLEKMLCDEGVLLLKYWFHLSRSQQKERLKAACESPPGPCCDISSQLSGSSWRRNSRMSRRCSRSSCDQSKSNDVLLRLTAR